MPQGISQREFARREGCDRKLVQRAVERGHLQPLADGSLDAGLVSSGWRRANRKAGDTSGDSGGDAGDVPTDCPQPPASVRPTSRAGAPRRTRRDEDPSDLIDTADFVEGIRNGRVYKLADSERVKEGALAFKQVLAARQAAGDLVELATAETVFFELARAARDSWANWPMRIGPLLAAELGLEADRVTEALTAHAHTHLADLGEPDPDFTPRSD